MAHYEEILQGLIREGQQGSRLEAHSHLELVDAEAELKFDDEPILMDDKAFQKMTL